MYKIKCGVCRKSLETPKWYQKFCSRKCCWKSKEGIVPINAFKKGNTGSKCVNWRGGKGKNGGYTTIYTSPKNYRLEHRVIAEKSLGRPLLVKEVIHHINEIKTDNRPSNLYLFPSQAKHMKWSLLLRYAKEFNIKIPKLKSNIM